MDGRGIKRLAVGTLVALSIVGGSLATGTARSTYAAPQQDWVLNAPSGQPGGGDRLGTTWVSEYRSGGGSQWTDTWTRRGNTNIFDTSQRDGTIRNDYVHEVTLQGNRVTVRRLSGPYAYCTYEGTLAADGRIITGAMTCSETYTWRATISGALAAAPPAPPPAAGPVSGSRPDAYCRTYTVDLSSYGVNVQVQPFDGATQYQGSWYCYANYLGIELWVPVPR